ncbi:hypothetical protein [Nocardia sp. NRRL S-836]|uniref:TRAFAC clade GTPase domain-containing protein n=1 Tax=Nocardia sp. NRRL S-836 TaxID=1519492 RepID=UPI0006B0439C|nr:hypothetical protein [Nocardia sp. NRRL S-836]KOV90041.1 hypothetical protein ADL03_01350 [Nocardia sp. NRRL S-836]
MYVVLAIVFLVVACSVGPYVLGLAIVGAAAVAFFVGVVEYVTAATAGFTPTGPIGHLGCEPPEESEDGPDPAYRSYYAGPVLLDYGKVLSQTFGQMWSKVVMGKRHAETGVVVPSVNDKVWNWVKYSTMPKPVIVPIAAAITVGLVVGTVGAMLFVGVSSVLFLALLVVLVVVALLTAGGSRLLELTLLFLRGITVECPTCHDKVTRPIYRCGSCSAAHRKLVPGLTGVLHRTCRCHTVLPTLLMLGKTKLRAQCPDCSGQLPLKGLEAPTVHIPVIAGPTAGKSVYMHSAISRLMLLGNGFEFADQRAKDDFALNLQRGYQDDPSRSVKTVQLRPRAYNVYVGAEGSRARRLLYLYDPAGEVVERADHLADTQFLKFTKGIVFIVDPFSLRQVRSETSRAVLGRVRASNTAPKDVLERFVEAMREKGAAKRGNRITIPLAVVLTKADGLLDAEGAAHPYAGAAEAGSHDDAVRAWLIAVGQRDLVASLDNHFSAVSYFVVSYQDARTVAPHGQVVNDDPAAPVMWLLNRKAR